MSRFSVSHEFFNLASLHSRRAHAFLRTVPELCFHWDRLVGLWMARPGTAECVVREEGVEEYPEGLEEANEQASLR